MFWRFFCCKKNGSVNNRARPGGCCGGRPKVRNRVLLILLILAVPPLELLRRYREEVWEYCPNKEFDWSVANVFKGKCEIPHLNLWDPTIAQYINAERKVEDCASDYPLVKMTWWPENPTKPSVLDLTERGRKEIAHLRCVFQSVVRNKDDKTLRYGDEKEANFPLEMHDEFVQVVCREKAGGATFYTDAFGTIIPVKSDSGGTEADSKKWNIVVLGIDSVSRLSFQRFLPKSYEWLKSRSDDGIYLFNAYHKIGENTFPNLVPMLTGRKVELSSPKEELQLPHSGNLVTYLFQLPFDAYPFIWKEFSSAGYVTSYVEDDPQIATFNLMKRGFSEQPTDHFGRTLFLTFDSYRGVEATVNPGLMVRNETTGISDLKEPRYFCINGRRKFEVHWDYSIRQFMTRYSGVKPMFVFSWLVGLTHEWLTTLKVGDLPLLETLKFMLGAAGSSSSSANKNDEEGNQPKWKDNTFVFLVSDHGQRVDKIRSTFVGRLEDRLPFLAISVPPAFRKKYPTMTKNLAANTQHLMTALDLYATFKHIHYLSTVNDEKANRDEPAEFTDVGPSGYAVSLFNEISSTRSCADAGIPEWYCACHRYSEINSTSKVALEASETMASMMQRDLQEATTKGLCANLSVARIESIKRVEFTTSARRYTSKCRFFGIIKQASDIEDVFDEYIVQVSMKPGGGLFEATVRNHWRTNEGWKVIGGIERVNRYGNQSACLPNSLERLRKTCFCV